MRERYLAIYLDDHRTASTAGRARARRLARETFGTAFGDVAAEVAREIADDREELLAVMRALGHVPGRAEQVVGALGERLGRLKPNGHLLAYSPLSRMLELEMLVVGITGKEALWTALEAALAGDARIDAARLGALAGRARSQRERLEPWRLAAARQALGARGVGGDSSSPR